MEPSSSRMTRSREILRLRPNSGCTPPQPPKRLAGHLNAQTTISAFPRANAQRRLSWPIPRWLRPARPPRGSAPRPEILRNFVGGQWVESRSRSYFDVHNPARGEVIAKTPLSDGRGSGRRRRRGEESLPRLARHAARRARPRDVQVPAASRGPLRGARPHRHDRARQDPRRVPRQRAARHRVRRGRLRRPVADHGVRPREHRDGHRLPGHPPAGRRRARRSRPSTFRPWCPSGSCPSRRDGQHVHRQAVRAGAAFAAADVRASGARATCRRASSTSSTAAARSSRRSATIPISAAVSFVGSTPVARAVYQRATHAGKRVQALGRREELHRRHAGRGLGPRDRESSRSRSTAARASGAWPAACSCPSARRTGSRATGWSPPRRR